MRQRASSLLATSIVLVAMQSGLAAGTPSPETRCREEVARQGQTYLRSAVGALRHCRDLVGQGKLPAATDCTIEPKAAASLARFAARFSSKVGGKCTDGVVAGLVFGDSCLGSSTVAELTSCELDVHQDQAEKLVAVLYDAGGPEPQKNRICQATVAKAAARVLQQSHDALRRCKNDVNEGRLPATTSCATQTATALLPVTARFQDKVGHACSDAAIAALDFGAPCNGLGTSPGLQACVLGTHRDGLNRVLVAEYGSGATGGSSSLKQIANASECIGGPLARCRVNDYILSNDRIRVVVQDIQRNLFGIGEYGGQIIDGDLVRTGSDPDRDNFEEWATAVNIENAVHYTDLVILNDGSDGQPAVLRATGVDDLLDFVNPSSTVADFGFTFPAAANDKDLPVEIMTDYVLEPGRNYVRVDTTVQNTSAAPLSIFFGEYLNGSGQVELWQSGYAYGEPLIGASCPANASNPCNGAFYAGYGDGTGVSYAYLNTTPLSSSFSTSGVTVELLGVESALALIGLATPNFPLAALGNPGDHRTFTRYFVVGDGSISSLLDARNQIAYLPVGTVHGQVLAGGSPAVGARVAILGNPAEGPGAVLGGAALAARNVVTQAVTDDLGNYSLTVPQGSYNLVVGLVGSPYEASASAPVQHPISVTAYQSVTQDVALPATGAVRVLVKDESNAPLAAKASIVGFDPSADPANTQTILGLINNRTGIFGDLSKDGLPFGLTHVHFLDQSGDSGVFPLEPGSYRVVVSHGPEYSIATADITVTAGATTTVNAQIARVIDSTGFVGSDFHVHSIDSPDCPVSRHDRIVSMLAEGVDFFTPSDHDFRSNFVPDIAALGATGLISVAVSGEITTFDYGHFNAWPMTIDPTKVNGGSVDHGGAAPDGQDFPQYGNYSLTPAQIIAAAHADPGTNTVQINHFYSHFGLGGGSGLAIDTGMVPPQSFVPGAARRLDPAVTNYFTPTFDALEMWIGDDRSQIFDNFYGRNLGDWFNLMNQGIIRAGVADSDTHKRIITQAGVPRTMVASPTDSPAALGAIADTLSGNVNARRAFGTNGPMLRITADAASTGEEAGLELGLPTLVHTTDGAVDVTVEIQSPIWAPFDRVEFYLNSATTKSVVNKQSGAGVVPVASYTVAPDFVKHAGSDFTVSTVTVNGAIPGAQRLEATVDLSLTGLAEDAWLVAIVRGTDGVSRPLFPVVPNSLKTSTNTTLANLIDGNLGEDGMPALAFTNAILIDVDGDPWTPPGVHFTP